MNDRNRSRLITVAVLVFGFAFVIGSVLHDWHGEVIGGQRPLSEDFGVFYCAGAAANEHRNPYLTDDLDRCGDGRHVRPARAYVHRQPAPIPGYDVALFRVFAELPFAPAAYLWLGLCGAAALGGVLALARVSSLPPAIVFLAVAPTMRESLRFGQLPPLLLAALAVSSYALQEGNATLAAFGALVTLIEPHVGLPVVIALFVWAPRTRVILAIGCALLAALSVGTLGLQHNIDYLRIVLPSQVLAEVPGDGQYSLTWLLYFFGVNESQAILAGSIQYAITCALGVFVAKLVADRLQLSAALPLIAAAFAVIGGPFIHSYQVALGAIVAAALIAGRTNSPPAWVALLLVCVSWDGESTWLLKPWSISRFESAFIAATLCVFALRRQSLAFRAAGAIVVLALYFGLTSAILTASLHQTRAMESPESYRRNHAVAQAYSTFEWGLLLRTSTENPSPEGFFTKLPPWLGLLCLIGAVAGVTRAQPRAVRNDNVIAPSGTGA